jgi:ribonuclease HI
LNEVNFEEETPSVQCVEHQTEGRFESTNLVSTFKPDDIQPMLFSQQEQDEPDDFLIIECNGYCPDNPSSLGAWSFVVLSTDRHRQLVDQSFGYIGDGERVTNNVAEYYAVLNALTWVIANAPDTPVEIFNSSQLVVNQVNGDWNCNVPILAYYRDSAIDLLRRTRAELLWLPLVKNQVALALSKVAYIHVQREFERGQYD